MLTGKEIIKDGNPLLREKAKDVQIPPSQEEQKTLQEMLEFVKNSQDPEFIEKYQARSGIGLAAPQIGILKKMIAVHLYDEEDNEVSYALFNPKIISHSVERSYIPTGEGCLSIDNEYPGYVPRYAKIRVRGFDIEGAPVELKLSGLTAIVFQHEIDHLNGILFYDHIDKTDPFKEIPNAIAIER